MRSLLAVFLVVGCGGKDGEGELPPPITLTSSATASAVDAGLDPQATLLLSTEHSLSAFLDLLLSDNTVRNTLWTDGGLGNTPFSPYTPCWTVPTPGISGFDYDVDLSSCSSEGYEGTIHVENTSVGPVVFTFASTVILDWTLTGSLALDYTADGDGTWHVYASDPASPTAPGTLRASSKDGDLTLTIDGGIQIASTAADYDWWGTWSDGTTTIGIGAAPAAAGSEVKPATWLDYTSMPAGCACQEAGVVVAEQGLAVTEVRVDLDDLQGEDDGVDDPEIVFTAPGAPTGGVNLDRGETCGTFVATDTAGSETFTFDEAALRAAFQAACDQGGVQDDGKCTRLQEAAAGASVTVTVPGELLTAALTDWSDDELDDGPCITDMGVTQ